MILEVKLWHTHFESLKQLEAWAAFFIILKKIICMRYDRTGKQLV